MRLLDFANKNHSFNFSLLPAPLHVPYREKDEDDDLEKAYKEVGGDLSAMLDNLTAPCQF